ncbi:MAG: nitroreductase family protein [Clostridia bacterium]
MNETLEVIRNRRSIRRFRPEQVAERELGAIVESALFAPSAMNAQPWHFTVIQDRRTLDRMAAIMRENMLKSGNEFMVRRASDPSFNPLYDAPTLILISADAKDKFGQFDCAAAAQNIALAAESLGVGSCIMGMTSFFFASQEGVDFARSLGVPDGYDQESRTVAQNSTNRSQTGRWASVSRLSPLSC